MSTVIQIGPVVVAEWSTITAAIVAAHWTVWASKRSSDDVDSGRRPTAPKSKSRTAKSCPRRSAPQEKLVVDRDGVRATFSRDARGALKLCLEGDHLSKAQLHALGEELMGRVTQQYAYHRIMSELKERNMTVVDEELSADQSVKIRVRNF